MTSLLDNVIALINKGIGDLSRLEHIKDTIENNKQLYNSDRNYVDDLIKNYHVTNNQNNNENIPTSQENEESKDTPSKNIPENKPKSKDTFCVKCGSNLELSNDFCIKCGTKKYSEQSTSTQNPSLTKTNQRSPFWYLLPIFFGIIGGIIAYFILKNTDHKKAKRSLIIGIISLILAIIIPIGLQVGYGTQNPFYVVASGSMIPVLQVYDIIIIQGHESFEDIKVGDIIAFNRPSDHDRIIVHRVASIIDYNPKTIRTKGDANPASIPGTDFPITKEEYIGKVVYVIPQLGYVTQLLKPPANYIFMVIFLGIIVIILGINHRKYKKSL